MASGSVWTAQAAGGTACLWNGYGGARGTKRLYLQAYDSISAAHQGLGRYLTCYNQHRPQRALDGKMPDKCAATT
jgi:hypothetical protein